MGVGEKEKGEKLQKKTGSEGGERSFREKAEGKVSGEEGESRSKRRRGGIQRRLKRKS